MPIYEYACEKCHKVSEFILMLHEEKPTLCPYCGGGLQKLMSSPSIQFKGSGWYVTDYARRPSAGDKEPQSAKTTKVENGSKDSKEVKESKEPQTSASKESPSSGTASADSAPPASKKES
jgi:putative FmdB family regulatory protein